ncbi:MAG TPA: septal ring lytic transglycosylase RlpA family protein [Hyphomicrobium sp.]|jgi:rare lipoprotein A|nr:septal ring lytic transglycosylase RlpA family protein [Hyphomicrobium sp.]
MYKGLSGRLVSRAMLVTTAAALASACSSDPPVRTIGGVTRSVFSEDDYGVSSSPRLASGYRIPKGGGHYKLGSPYKVAGRWYVPRENPNYVETGVASWYGADFHGRKTANGEVFDANALTAAHPTLPLPCYAVVTNLDNGKSVMVRVNDRGPYVNDRVIDMSYAAAKQLGYLKRGRARVRVQYAGRAPLNGDDRREQQYLAEQQGRGRSFPPVAVASNQNFNAAPPRREYATLPPDASDRWSPLDYRSALAGKPVRAPRPAAAAPVETASVTNYDRRRMSLSAPPPIPQETIRPFAPARTYVQVGLFRDRSNAERLRRVLGTVGPIEVAPMQAGDGTNVYRVRVGPVPPRDVNQMQQQIAAYGVADTAIVTD